MLCPALYQPRDKHLVHHDKVVCINVEHVFYVHTRRLVVALECERARSRYHKTDVQVLHLLCEFVEKLWGKRVFAGEVDLN